jgi:hypothetical protein
MQMNTQPSQQVTLASGKRYFARLMYPKSQALGISVS